METENVEVTNGGESSTNTNAEKHVINMKKILEAVELSHDLSLLDVYCNVSIPYDNVEEDLIELRTLFKQLELSNLSSLDYGLLCFALKYGKSELINYYLGKNFKVNCNAVKISHDTPLHLAVLNNNIGIVEKLLDKGADMVKENQIRQNPFDIAIKLRCDEILTLLVDHISDDNITNEAYLRLLNDLLDNDHELLVEKLLKKCFKIGIWYLTFPENILWKAVRKKYHQSVKLMLERDVYVDFSDVTNCRSITALHIACENGDSQMVKLLLENGASCEKLCWFEKINDLLTPLQTAIAFGHISLLDIFLDFGIDVNVQHKDRYTRKRSLLHVACRYNQVEIIELLLSRGMDINVQNEDGLLPIVECYPENLSAFNCLIGKENFLLDYRSAEYIIYGCMQSYPGKVDRLMNYIEEFGSQKFKNKIYKNLINSQGDRSLLNQAARMSLDDKSIDTLVRYGADVNVRNKFGRTPIFVAFLGRHKLQINQLLKYGAEINLKCRKGLTPMDYIFILQFPYNVNENHDIAYYDAHGVGDFDEFIELISQHLVKMKLLNLYVNEKNYESVIGKANDPYRHKKKYKKEIDKMKDTVISNNVNYYDIVKADLYKLMMYLKDDVIFKALKSESYQSEFPEFSIIISGCFYRASIRKNLLDTVSCYTIFDIIKNLPYPCMRNVIDNFTNTDLRNIIYEYNVLKSTKKPR